MKTLIPLILVVVSFPIYAEGYSDQEWGEHIINYLEEKIGSGDTEAQHELGELYAEGSEYVPKDIEKAIYHFTEAANKGHAPSQTRLGIMYATGEGVEENDAASYVWLLQAAAQNEKAALFLLGVRHSQDDENKDYVKAFSFMERSAKQGVSAAQHELARMYGLGRGTIMDVVKCYAWTSVAASQGYEQSQKLIEKMRKGLSKDTIEQGNALAKEYWNMYVYSN